MKKYKYVRLGLSGESREVDGNLLHVSTKNNPLPNDLNRLLEEGWRPVRETVMDWYYRKRLKRQHYPFIFILLEKEISPVEETRITEASSNRVIA